MKVFRSKDRRCSFLKRFSRKNPLWVLAVAVVSCFVGCEGFAAVSEVAAGAGLDLGLGGLSIGTLGLGTLGIGVLGLDLGIIGLSALLHPSTIDPTGQSRGGGGGGQGAGNGGTGPTITGPPGRSW